MCIYVYIFIYTYIHIGILGNSIDGCVFHFLAVILFDILTLGACGNPAVCIALFLAGKMSFIGTFVRLVAEILVSLIAFSMLYSVIPSYLIPISGGPELASGIDMFHGSLIEGSIAFAFALTVLLASVFVTEPELNRPLFAAVIRVLIIFGGSYTGANMNPMIGFSWAWYTNRSLSSEYQIVYSIAPLIGGITAAFIFHLFMMVYSVEKITDSKSVVSEGEKVTKKLSKKEINEKKKLIEKAGIEKVTDKLPRNDANEKKKLISEEIIEMKRITPKSKKRN
jgi:glycerol uptake facilitator-like aquaporin